MRWIDGYHFELVIGQGILKFFELGYSTRTFRDVSQSVKFLSFAFLNGTTLFEVAVIWVTRVAASIHVGFHGHDGSGAT